MEDGSGREDVNEEDTHEVRFILTAGVAKNVNTNVVADKLMDFIAGAGDNPFPDDVVDSIIGVDPA